MAGIKGVNNITYENITKIVSGTEPQDFWLRVNYLVFNGILYFVLLWILWYIIFIFAQKAENQPMHNMFYASALTSIIGFFVRAIYGMLNGFTISLITDAQLWIFPILTAVLGATIWASKRE